MSKVEFCGYEWSVRTADQPQGPGPNCFASDNVSVVNGRLHLKIQQIEGEWLCGAVFLDQSLGYGRYSLTVASDVSKLDPNVVFGFFVFSNDPAYSHREIDLEIAKWGKKDLANGQFVIQPHDRPERTSRFVVPQRKRHRFGFTWLPDQVVGHHDHGATSSLHSLTRGIPPAKDETTRINLWLFRGQPPTDGKPVEVIIADFKFTPHVPLWHTIIGFFRRFCGIATGQRTT